MLLLFHFQSISRRMAVAKPLWTHRSLPLEWSETSPITTPQFLPTRAGIRPWIRNGGRLCLWHQHLSPLLLCVPWHGQAWGRKHTVPFGGQPCQLDSTVLHGTGSDWVPLNQAVICVSHRGKSYLADCNVFSTSPPPPLVSSGDPPTQGKAHRDPLLSSGSIRSTPYTLSEILSLYFSLMTKHSQQPKECRVLGY